MIDVRRQLESNAETDSIGFAINTTLLKEAELWMRAHRDFLASVESMMTYWLRRQRAAGSRGWTPAAVAARSEGLTSSRATSLLVQAVRNQANVLSFRDGFLFVSLTVIVMLLLAGLLRPPPVQS